MVGRAGIVSHHVHVMLVDYVAAEVLLKLHAALKGHAQVAALVVGGEEFLR